jgi:hypothetical protein
MNAPVWIFITILIIVCILIAFGILALVLVSLNDSNHASLKAAEAAALITKAETKVEIQKEETQTETTQTVLDIEPEKDDEIKVLKWSADSAILHLGFRTTASSVRFVLRSTEFDNRWPAWTSGTINVLQPGAVDTSLRIRDTKAMRMFNDALLPQHKDAFIMEMENAHTYQVLAHKFMI